MKQDDYRSRYLGWRDAMAGSPDLLAELEHIEQDDGEIYDRFYKDLEFGTGGLRGLIGAGTNRMNIFTVGRAAAGLGKRVTAMGGGAVAIAYDNRHNSDLFARRAASVMAAQGVQVHIFPEMAPTPLLSFAVRQLGCKAGIVVTASHNPAEYNGFKAYGEDGGQLGNAESDALFAIIEAINPFDVAAIPFEEGLESGIIRYVDDELIGRYLAHGAALLTRPDVIVSSGLSVVYTPLYGTGLRPVEALFKGVDFQNYHIVPEQRDPDGNFPTAPYPNPEDPAALALALKLAGEQGADLVIATDPDADRLSVALLHGGTYVQLSGNQMGCLLFDYLAEGRQAAGAMPDRAVGIRSVVSTPMFDRIAEHYGVQPIAVLTGFKNMAGQMWELEKRSEIDRFVFAFEESNGFLPGPYVRDKDGVITALLFVEMAAVEKDRGRTLLDRLDDLYRRHGYFATRGRTFTFAGAAGMEAMAGIMDSLRAHPPTEIGGVAVSHIDDYKDGFASPGLIGDKLLAKTNMLIVYLTDGSTAVVRPSGTEPKLKLYLVFEGADGESAAAGADRLADQFATALNLQNT